MNGKDYDKMKTVTTSRGFTCDGSGAIMGKWLDYRPP